VPGRTPRASERLAAASRRAIAVAFALVFAALLAPVAAGLFYQGLDLFRVSAGLLCAARERIGRLEAPWLSPLLENGALLFGRPDAELLYPPRWLAIALPVEYGLALEVALHLAIAAAATTWLLRTFRIRPFGAACGGVAFALCGTSVDLVRHGHYVNAAAWLPLAWAASRVSMSSFARPRHVALLTASLALCLLGAEPQAFVVGCALVAMECGRALWRRRRAALLPAARAAGAMVAAAAVGWAQWAPVQAELVLSRRRTALRALEAFIWSFSPPSWLGTILPGAPTRLVQPGVSVHQVLESPIPFPWNLSAYAGPLLLAAAVCGLALRRTRAAAAVMLAGVILSLGDGTPVLPGLTKLVPPLMLFRYPAKYMLVATLAAVVLGAAAFEAARRPAIRRLRWALAAAAIAMTLQAVCVRLFGAELDAMASSAAAEFTTEGHPDLPTLSQWLADASLRALMPLLGAIAVVAFVPRLRRFAFVLVAADLALAAPVMLQLEPPLLSRPSPLASLAVPGAAELFRKPNAESRKPAPPVVCSLPALGQLSYSLGKRFRELETNLPLRLHALPEIQACDGLSSGAAYSPLESSLSERLLTHLMDNPSVMPATALGCSHIVSDVEVAGAGAGRRDEFPVDPLLYPELASLHPRLRVYEIANPVPGVFVPRNPAVRFGEIGIAREIAAAASTEDLLRIVDDPLHRLAAAPLPSGAGVESIDAQWSARHRAQVRVRGTGGALVGLRTTFLVGWHARQAGRELPVVRVAGNQTAAVVEDVAAGPVDFEYRVPALVQGFLVALAGAAAAAALARSARRRTLRR